MGKALISKHFLVILLFFIAAIYIVGNLNFLNLKFWWFDIPLHFLGGAWLGILFLVYFSAEGRSSSGGKKYFSNFESEKIFIQIIIIVGFVLIIGVGWEIFEFLLEQVFILKNPDLVKMTVGDTLKDLVMDSFGGILIAVIYGSKPKNA